jgi:predicted ATPase
VTTHRLLEPGHRIAHRYRVEGLLGRGGMGSVYEVLDEELALRVALKTLHLAHAGEPAAIARSVRRLKREVLLARGITHPNVCRTFDVGRDDVGSEAFWFLTMELVRGERLSRLIGQRGRLSADEAQPIVEQLGAALDAAHRAGVVHRDLKSDNIMVAGPTDDRRVVVMDFGLAATVANRHPDADAAHATTVSAGGLSPPVLVGTPAYMSPEQVQGREATAASDIYALGVVLYQMMTGVLPFDGDTPWEVACRRLCDAPRSPCELVPELEPRWESVILRCLAREPHGRFPRAGDAARVLCGQESIADTSASRVTATYPRARIPAELDTFVGRTPQLEELARRLDGPDRCVTLLGPPGIGKTRLALRYGHDQAHRWPGGVWFCDLCQVRGPAGIAMALATALDVPLGADDAVERLGHAIAGRGRTLIILDGFEASVEHADTTLGAWLRRSTGARFLVTSRDRLRIPGEVVQTVAALDVATEGLDLFETRAQEHRASLLVDAPDRERIRSIVEALDGIPLAIELAAARLRVLDLEQLAQRLARRLQLLAAGPRGRHESLRGALDGSWELLPPPERSAIAQATLFAGGFTLEAAESIIDLSAHADAPDQTHADAPDLLDVMQSLVDRSWLRIAPGGGVPRFEMYGPIADYAREALPDDRLPELEARHGRFFAGLGSEEAIDALSGHDGRTRRAALALEFDNLVVACRRALQRDDGAVAAATWVAASAVFRHRGPYSAAVDLGRSVIEVNLDPAWRGRALYSLAQAERLTGEMDAARERFAAVLTASREAGDRRTEGVALGDLAILDRLQGRSDEAREHLLDALAIFRQIENSPLEGMALGSLGILERNRGRMDEAREHLEAALAVHSTTGNRRLEGIALGNLGMIDRDQGRLASARARFDAEFTIHRDEGDRRSEAIALANLAVLDRDAGHLEAACRRLEAALTMQREVGDRNAEAITLGNLGVLCRDAGHLEDARGFYEEALAIHRETGHRRSEAIVLGSLATLRHDAGNHDAARQQLEESLAIHRDVGNRHGEAMVLGHLGLILEEQERTPEAFRAIEAAIEIATELEDRSLVARLLCSRAGCEDAAGARATLAEAETIARTLEMAPESELARELAALRTRIATGGQG